MEHILVIIALLGLYYFYRYYYRDDGNDYCPVMNTDQEGYQEKESNMEETISTRQLVLTTIEKIGSNPECTVDERIQFEYQGVIFLMEAVDDCKFVNLIGPWCHSFSKFDIDEFSRVRQVLNNINARGMTSVFYSITDSDEVAVHIKKHFLFVLQIPNIEDYLKLMLDIFFRTARTLHVEIEKCRVQECK